MNILNKIKNKKKTGIILFLILSCDFYNKNVHDTMQFDKFTHCYKMVRKLLIADKFELMFTDYFILIDVNIDLIKSYRFPNYSGDLPSQYIEVLKPCYNKINCLCFENLMKEILKYKQSDERFELSKLIFTWKYINKRHIDFYGGITDYC
jgi:hypothetical protein